MPRLALFFLTLLTGLSSFGQAIRLTQTKSDKDIEVINGQYSIYVNPRILILAITKIDKALLTDDSQIIDLVKSDRLHSVDMHSTDPADKPFVALLKSNLGAYLLMNARAAVYKGTTRLPKIVADISPEMVEIDGTSRVSIAFSENGSDNSVFLGLLSTKPVIDVD